MRWIGPRLEQWTQDGVLQLQRRLGEARGEAGWRESDKEVPVRDHMNIPSTGYEVEEIRYSEEGSKGKSF